MRASSSDRGLLDGLIGDGRSLLAVTGLSLLFAGAFALFVSVNGQFLPHDIAFLGVSADELCRMADCRVVAFMFHDRVAFGGTLIAIGVLYLWLTSFPLRRREPWAWWTLATSGTLGFLSFLAYLAYGYLDSWHAVGTVFLLPAFAAGLARSFPRLREPRGIASLLRADGGREWRAPGRALLLLTAGGMIAAGLIIMGVGMTQVFVRADLEFMRITSADLDAINRRLIPLIAHDRAGFGGGLASCGVVVACCAWCARPSRSLWQALFLAGVAGFGCAIGVHLVVGYTDPWHLAPALAGAALFALGIGFSYPGRVDSVAEPQPTQRFRVLR